MESPAADHPDPPQPPPGLAQLDAVLQHRSRLGAMVLLSRSGALTFSRLKALLDETDGNLGAQLRKLEDARYVRVKKEFIERRPTSWYAITPAGQDALRRHLKAIESLLKSADL